mgnify:CR=1 FL=1
MAIERRETTAGSEAKAVKAHKFLGSLKDALLAAGREHGSVRAQDREAPYGASLRFDRVNMRVGPSESYPIDWVYHRSGLPVKVVRL